MESHKSDIVLSLKGRDAGMQLLVVDEEDGFVFLANGKGRRAESPKRKKQKHVKKLGTCDERTRQKLLESGRLTNSEIRRALSIWTEETDAN